MNKFSRTARSMTFAAIVGLSMGVTAPAALAQDYSTAINPGAATGGAGAGNIDFSQTGAITIHKRIGAEKGVNNSGIDLGDSAPGTKIGDGRVKFKITKVEADLKTNEGFADAKKLTTESAKKVGETTAKEVTGGQAAFDGLELGVYYVEEEVIEQPTVGQAQLVPSKPFLVFVPTTGPGGNAWNYNVHVYPKNSESKVEKTVVDKGKNTNDEYTYSISGDAPAFGNERQLTKFQFQDKLDKRLTQPKVLGITAGDVKLEVGDWQVTNVDLFTVELNSKGLEKVKSGVKVTMTFSVKRTEVGEDIKLENEATVIFNNPSTGDDFTQKTNKVETYHGKLKVLKQDNDSNEALKGAKFELYRCQKDTTLDALAGEQKLTVNGLESWATDDKGELVINGLHITDFEDGKEVSETYKYCLVETEAPAGYKKLTEPVKVTFTRNAVAATDSGLAGDDAVTLVAKVNNLRQDTPDLPMTGGAGVGILAAIGAAIVAAGAWFARRGTKN